MELKELDPYTAAIVRAYAARRNLSEKEFLEMLEQYPGDTVVDKIEAYIRATQGITVKGTFLDALNPVPGDGYFSVLARFYLPEETVKAVDDEFGVKLPQDTQIRFFFRNERAARRFASSTPLAVQGVIYGLKVKVDATGAPLVSARGFEPRGIDSVLLSKFTPATQAFNEDFDQGEEALVTIDTAGVVDPIREGAFGPQLRVYFLDGAVEVSLRPAAIRLLKRYVDDPWSKDFWASLSRDNPLYTKLVYNGQSGSLKRFSCTRVVMVR